MRLLEPFAIFDKAWQRDKESKLNDGRRDNDAECVMLAMAVGRIKEKQPDKMRSLVA